MIHLRIEEIFSKMMKYAFSGLKITNKISTWKQFIIHCATGLLVGSCGVTAIIKSPFECIMLFRQGFILLKAMKSKVTDTRTKWTVEGDEIRWSLNWTVA